MTATGISQFEIEMISLLVYKRACKFFLGGGGVAIFAFVLDVQPHHASTSVPEIINVLANCIHGWWFLWGFSRTLTIWL